MTERFIARLTETGRRFVILQGDRRGRLQKAVAAIEAEPPAAFGFAEISLARLGLSRIKFRSSWSAKADHPRVSWCRTDQSHGVH